MTKRAFRAGTILLVLFMVQPAAATAPAGSVTAADIDYLTTYLPIRHPDPFHDYPESAFRKDAAELKSRIDKLAPHLAALEIQRLLARLGEGHTGLKFLSPPLAPQGFPLRFRAFSDGIFVTASAKEHADVVGHALVSIGGVPVEEAQKRIGALVSADNPMGRLKGAPFLMSVDIVLDALGLSDSLGKVRYKLKSPGGRTRTVTVEARPAKEVEALLDPAWEPPAGPDLVRARDTAKKPAPLYLSHNRELYWHEVIPQHKALFVQINRLYDEKDRSFAAFTEDVFRSVDGNGIEKLVVDLRNNAGGNHIHWPFIYEILKRPNLNRRGKLFVLIGRGTFSAGQTFVTHLEQHTEAIFLGEPTSMRPNGFGAIRSLKLPDSGLTLSHSRSFIQLSDPADYRIWTAPGLPVAVRFADYRENVDPVLQAALGFVPTSPPPLRPAMEKAFETSGIEGALAAYRTLKPDYDAAALSTEQILNRIGYDLLRAEMPDAAVAIFKANAEAWPRSPNVWDSLADGYLALGDREAAARFSRKALELNPMTFSARSRLQEMTAEAESAAAGE